MKFACLVGTAVGTAALAVLVGCGSSTSSQASPSTSTDAGSNADALAAGDGGSGSPVTGLMQSTWIWVPVGGAHCRDGSDTGFAVNQGTKSDKLMIYLEGGGACFNSLTCAATPTAFGKTEFTNWLAGSALATPDNGGVLNRMDSANPVKDWNFVYIPYCTGDIHSGNNPNGMVPSVGKQEFVGYANVGLDLQRIVPTFTGLSQVLLTGISAGGFGAAANYVQVANAFGSTPVYMLDDSGPAMEDPYLPTCQQTEVKNLWGLESTVLKDCGTDCNDPSKLLLQYSEHLGKTYPKVPFGLIESTEDMTISQFFGFGQNNCANNFSPIPGPEFTMGLEDLRSKLNGTPNFGSFFFPGTQHTSLGGDSSFDTGSTNATNTFANSNPDGGTTPEGGSNLDGGVGDAAGSAAQADAGTIALTTWVTQFIGGTVSNVGP